MIVFKMKQKHPEKLKEEIRYKYIYDVSISYGCGWWWTLTDLAIKYRIPLGTLKRWSSEEGWYEKQQKHLSKLWEVDMIVCKIIEKEIGEWNLLSWEIEASIMDYLTQNRIIAKWVEGEDTEDYERIITLVKRAITPAKKKIEKCREEIRNVVMGALEK